MNEILIEKTRTHLEPCWIWSHEKFAANPLNGAKRTMLPEVPSAYMCRHTCAFLLRLFEAAGDRSWKVCGGLVSSDGLHANSPARHWWLEKDGMILDLTADQFGLKPITNVVVSDSRYLKIEELSSRRHVTSLKHVVDQWCGVPRNFGDEGDKRLNAFAVSYEKLRDEFVLAWNTESLMPSAEKRNCSSTEKKKNRSPS